MNAVSGNLAHLVHLISHYLGLRLPAEMVLPHRDCPHPTILPPSQSYAAQQLSFPQIGSAQLSSNSAPASRALLKSQKLRPNLQSLYLTKTLTLLAKDDPRAYAEFLESVTLLAWNIAWLCKSQGIDAEIASWEGVCNIAKNLQHFLATKNVERPLPSAARDSPRRQATYNSDPLLAPADCRDSQQCTTERQRTRLGQLSHDTAHSNLVSAAGSSDMHRWRLQDPSKIVERVKHMLQSDRTGAGWEMLDGKEWEAEPTTAQLTAPPSIVDASPVVVSHRIEADDPLGGPNPKLKTQATADEPEHDKGTSGWTKLKSR